MINFYKEEFDTKIIGKNVFKLFVEGEITNEREISNLLKDDNIDIVFCFCPLLNRNSSILEDLGFRLISIRSIYKMLPVHELKTTQDDLIDFQIIQNSKSSEKFNPGDIENMARIIGSTSRYFKDEFIPQEKSLKLYAEWLNNSIYNHYADEVFSIVGKDGKLIGIITLKIKNNTGFLDLLGIHNDFQGQGLGKILLQKGIQYFFDKNIKEIIAVVGGENIPINIFYQKNNFITTQTDLIYHKHFNEK